MTGNETGESREDLFVWDETTHLYFHSRSGFYHDPTAGWYYSTNDGLYYKFDNGKYVLWDSLQDEGSQNRPGLECSVEVASYDPCVETSCPIGGRDNSTNSLSVGEGSAQNRNQALGMPPPPSEWLEDTLINTYLSGCNPCIDVGDNSAKLWAMSSENSFKVSAKEDEETSSRKPGELVKKYRIGSRDQTVGIKEEDLSLDELGWLAQYGQVVHSWEEPRSELSTVDLWDWSMVKSTRKRGKDVPARLVGRLTKSAAKLHPSMPSTSSLLRTAPITEVHLDLVRVGTGKIYKLRCPSARYLASLTSYNSSNPTKDWDFPDLSFVDDVEKVARKPSDENCERNNVAMFPKELAVLQMKSNVYRDRAAERRMLHRNFGLGPGHKISLVGGSGVFYFQQYRGGCG